MHKGVTLSSVCSYRHHRHVLGHMDSSVNYSWACAGTSAIVRERTFNFYGGVGDDNGPEIVFLPELNPVFFIFV